MRVDAVALETSGRLRSESGRLAPECIVKDIGFIIVLTIRCMEVVFDPAKDAENVRKHGMSLAQFLGWCSPLPQRTEDGDSSLRSE